MSDSYGNQQANSGRNFPNQRDGRNNFRGGRGQGNREPGGFRIRLSDNEMRAARSLQEAFNLRSTVAVLGFALRTLAQLLEEGKLNDLLSQYNSQSASKERKRVDGRRGNFDDASNSFENLNNQKPNPFARPEKPQATNLKESSIEIKDSEEDSSKESSKEISNTVETTTETETQSGGKD